MERRKAVRITSQNLIRLEALDASGVVVGKDTGKTENVSIGGAYFLYKEELPLNSVVDIQFQAHGVDIRAKSRVVRVEKKGNTCGIGVRFMLEDESTLEMLQNLAYLE